jgi:small subunit ribosomal protein S6
VQRDYELVLVVSPEAGDEGFPATVERVSKFIQDRGGEIKNVDQWGRRRLAYPIHRATEAFYAVMHISIEPTQVRPLEGNLDLAEDVLRHLVVRWEEVPPPAPRRGRFAAAAQEDGERVSPPRPKPDSRIGREALVAAGQAPSASPEASALTPREQARVEAGVGTSDLPEGEAPVAEEAGLEPEEPEGYATTEPSAAADEKEE